MPLQPIVRPMGHNPIPPAVHRSPPRPTKPAWPTWADGATIWERMGELERKLRHRRSRLRWRRRRAYAACLALIELRHSALELLDIPPGIPEPGGLPPRAFPAQMIRK